MKVSAGAVQTARNKPEVLKAAHPTLILKLFLHDSLLSFVTVHVDISEIIINYCIKLWANIQDC